MNIVPSQLGSYLFDGTLLVANEPDDDICWVVGQLTKELKLAEKGQRSVRHRHNG